MERARDLGGLIMVHAENGDGGDLLGNVWRFDLNSDAAAVKIAVLKDAAGTPQPITAKPELGRIIDKKIVFVGTGRYLGTSDLATADCMCPNVSASVQIS